MIRALRARVLNFRKPKSGKRLGFARYWRKVGLEFMPFADAASEGLPLGRLLRLSLFQVSVGMAAVLLIGTLNRVMIVELALPATIVGFMVSLPVLFAPFRALIGWKSDTHFSYLGWRRVPYIWFGTMLQFGGFSIMPFALILLSGDTDAHPIVGQIAAAVAFLLVGAGMNTVQTVGFALATDIAPADKQPRVVALLSVMMLVGMVVSSVLFSWVLWPFSQVRLIQVIQGVASVTMVLNLIALWKQEGRDPSRTRGVAEGESFGASWRTLRATGPWRRRMAVAGLGTAAFSMQDILLEPYGGQILGLSVAGTTFLTAVFATGGIAGFILAARAQERGADAHRVAGMGVLLGTFAFALVIAAAPFESVAIFAFGTLAVGHGAGLFAHATLTAAMKAAPPGQVGLALGAWGAVQATAAGVSIALSGLLRDGAAALGASGELGPMLAHPATGYGLVYCLEIALLFATLVALGPLVAPRGQTRAVISPQLAGTGALAAPLTRDVASHAD